MSRILDLIDRHPALRLTGVLALIIVAAVLAAIAWVLSTLIALLFGAGIFLAVIALLAVEMLGRASHRK